MCSILIDMYENALTKQQGRFMSWVLILDELMIGTLDTINAYKKATRRLSQSLEDTIDDLEVTLDEDSQLIPALPPPQNYTSLSFGQAVTVLLICLYFYPFFHELMLLRYT